MKIVFLSNFYNHHQSSLSRAFYRILKDEYSFIETIPMDTERQNLGYQTINDSFIFRYYETQDKCDKLIEEADIIIFGSAPYKLIKSALKSGKLVFQYSERIYKKVPPKYQIPLRAIKYWVQKGRYHNMYLLCASAFTSADYSKTKTFINKAYKWGYFPETKYYNIDELLSNKDKKEILWVGRFLDWKHTDDAIKVADCLKNAGYDFHLDIIGTGVMEKQLKDMVSTMELTNYVNFLGAIPSDMVRKYMEKAGLYIFTSDRNEGWGAVLNESMNSACAVVASHEIGAVPYLLHHKENGMIYKSCDIEGLYRSVKYLLENPFEQERLGKAAYETIISEWNAQTAAERIIQLIKCILNGNDDNKLYSDGPCSKAKIIQDDWYKE